MSVSSEEYHDHLSLLFKTWVYGGVVEPPSFVLPPLIQQERYDPSSPLLVNFTDPVTGDIWGIIPDCTPTADFELDCFNGIDDDCNGGLLGDWDGG